MNASRSTTIREPIRFACPFCKREASAGYEQGDDRPVVLHVMPMCETFARLGPVEYLRAVNDAIGAPR